MYHLFSSFFFDYEFVLVVLMYPCCTILPTIDAPISHGVIGLTFDRSNRIILQFNSHKRANEPNMMMMSQECIQLVSCDFSCWEVTQNHGRLLNGACSFIWIIGLHS